MKDGVALDDLLLVQAEIAGRNERFLINLRKMGRTNITLSVLEARRELLEDYWKTFMLGHRSVIRDPEASASDYVKNDRFADVEEVYLQHSATLRDMQRELEPNSAPATTVIPLLDVRTTTIPPFRSYHYRLSQEISWRGRAFVIASGR